MALRPPGNRGLLNITTLLCFLLSLLVTLVALSYSHQHGRLSIPVTYDDVSYCNDALKRLRTIYAGGLPRLASGLVREPPHSPYSTGMALAGYLLFGTKDWAPYASNFLVVLAFLLAVSRWLRGLPFAAQAAGYGFAVSLPMAINSVHEFKPDMPCSLAIALLLTWNSRFVTRPPRPSDIAPGVALLALSLLIKPTYVIATALFGVAAAAAALVLGYLTRPNRRKPLLEVRTLAVTAVIGGFLALPYYALRGKNLFDYIFRNAFGAHKDVWAVKSAGLENLLYFLTGPGGSYQFGYHVVPLALAIGAGLAVALWRRGRMLMLCHAFFAAVAVATYAVPTWMEVKNSFSAATFQYFTVFWAFFSFRSVVRETWSGPAAPWPQLARGLAAAFALSVGAIRFTPGFPMNGPDTVLRNRLMAAHHEFLRDRAIRRHAAQPGGTLLVTLTSTGLVHNIGALQYLLLKDGIENVLLRDYPFQSDPAQVAGALRESDLIITNDPNTQEAFEWLPSGKIQAQMLAMARSLTDFTLVSSVRTVQNARYYVYERTQGLSELIEYHNFGSVEGPFPEAGLPRFRWGLGPESSLEIAGDGAARRTLLLSALASEPNQTLRFLVDGKEVLSHQFQGPGRWETIRVPLPSSGSTLVEIRYATWRPGDGRDPRKLAAMFRTVQVVAEVR